MLTSGKIQAELKFFAKSVVIPVTCRLKGYTRFVGKYVTGM